jgi:hypothetical protein
MRGLIIKVGNEPAMEMPAQMMRGPGDQKRKRKMIEKGMESIKVPAETFKARHMQYQDGETVVDTWIHQDVSPYGIVKSQSKDFEMVLLGNGTGATTLITEIPRKFELPPMPGNPPRSK